MVSSELATESARIVSGLRQLRGYKLLDAGTINKIITHINNSEV